MQQFAFVTIPDSVTSIGDSAFSGCDAVTIYGFQGSAAQEYAVKYNIPFAELNKLVDTENQISVAETVPGSIPENAQLKIECLQNTQDEIIYDFTLEKDGEPIQPTDGITVSIPVPQTMNTETCKVFYIDDSGNLTDMNAVYEDGYMTFGRAPALPSSVRQSDPVIAACSCPYKHCAINLSSNRVGYFARCGFLSVYA